MTDHFLVVASKGVQPFSTKEFVGNSDNGISILEPVFDGFAYNFEVLTYVSFLPSFHHHHMELPKINLQVAVGLGIPFTYRTKKQVQINKSPQFLMGF